MKEYFDDDQQQCTPFLPTFTPTILGFWVSNFGLLDHQEIDSAMTHVLDFEC